MENNTMAVLTCLYIVHKQMLKSRSVLPLSLRCRSRADKDRACGKIPQCGDIAVSTTNRVVLLPLLLLIGQIVLVRDRLQSRSHSALIALLFCDASAPLLVSAIIGLAEIPRRVHYMEYPRSQQLERKRRGKEGLLY